MLALHDATDTVPVTTNYVAFLMCIVVQSTYILAFLLDDVKSPCFL